MATKKDNPFAVLKTAPARSAPIIHDADPVTPAERKKLKAYEEADGRDKPRREPTKQISLHIPMSLYKRWRTGLSAMGVTGTDLIEAYIETWLEKHKDEIRNGLG